MAESNPGPKAQAAQPLSMRIVMRRSGLTRQTIHFYLRKGLLPKPQRTSRTYALYSPETLDLLEMVKQCRAGLRLSLDEIVQLFSAAAYDPTQIREEVEKRGINGTGAVQHAMEIDSAGRPVSTSELLSTLQPAPPEGWMQSIQRVGLVDAHADKHSPEGAAFVRAIWDARQAGCSMETLEKLGRRIDQESETELRRFSEAFSRNRPAECHYPDAIKMFDAMERFVLRKRREGISKAFFKVLAPIDRLVDKNQRRIIPSETFLVKMGLNREMDRLLNVLDRNPSDLRSLKGLASAYNLRCDWLMLNEVSGRILQADPMNVLATASKARAMYYLGQVDEAVALLDRSLRAQSDPLLKFRLGQTLVLRAQNAGLTEFLRALAQKESLTMEALREAAGQPGVRRWILLDRALDNLTISDPLGLDQPSLQELEALYGEYQAVPEKGLSRMSVISLALGRVLAGYALYLLYRRLGMAKAEPLRRKLVRIDPHSVLAGQVKNDRPVRIGTRERRPKNTGRRALKRAVV